jgi:hypothetical protein
MLPGVSVGSAANRDTALGQRTTWMGKTLPGKAPESPRGAIPPGAQGRNPNIAPTAHAVATARRLGERAGRGFVTYGIWPRNPFRAPGLEALAASWKRAMLTEVGQARRRLA